MKDYPEWVRLGKSSTGGWSTFAALDDDPKYIRSDLVQKLENKLILLIKAGDRMADKVEYGFPQDGLKIWDAKRKEISDG